MFRNTPIRILILALALAVLQPVVARAVPGDDVPRSEGRGELPPANLWQIIMRWLGWGGSSLDPSGSGKPGGTPGPIPAAAQFPIQSALPSQTSNAVLPAPSVGS